MGMRVFFLIPLIHFLDSPCCGDERNMEKSSGFSFLFSEVRGFEYLEGV